MTVLLGAGMVGAWSFVLTFLVDGGTRPGYHPVRQPVSALALGSRGWVQVTNFVVSGLLITVSAPGLYEATQSVWLAGLVAIFGVALVASGVFPMDPMRGYPPGTPDTTPSSTSRRHTLHDWAGTVVFIGLPATAVVAALILQDAAWVVYSGVTAAVVTACSILFGTAWEADSPKAGLFQRLVLVPGLIWLGLLCWHLTP